MTISIRISKSCLLPTPIWDASHVRRKLQSFFGIHKEEKVLLVFHYPHQLVVSRVLLLILLSLSQKTAYKFQKSSIMDLSTLPRDWIVTSGQFTKTAHTNIYPAIDPTKPENSLEGMTIVITGASRGLGAKSIAPAFAEAGVKAIVLIATNASKLVHVREELQKARPDLEVLALSADISSAEQVSAVWAEINARYPKVHVLVNNAGVECTESEKPMHEQDPDVFMKNFVSNRININLRQMALTIG
jgi:hypothetical protein